MKPRTLLLLLALASCDDAKQAEVPPAREPGRADVGHYCGMILVDHPGPKAQIFLASRAEPLWFAQVRDAVAFTRLPEEPRDIRAIWVNDMGRTDNWETPQPGAWVEARSAWYVIGSDSRGGMGAAETVPFGTLTAARAFAGPHGGTVVRLDEIPDDYVLGETSSPAEPASDQQHPHALPEKGS
jgi:copper chaperone NosL